MSNWRLGAAALTAGVTLSQALAAYADTRVGVTGAVNPSAAGTPPGADTRQLTVGSDIVFRERVLTTTDGQAQILFLDQSTLMIGPNSTVVIDEFVYDPSTNKGNIAATLTQGSFRYIGGKLSKQGNAALKTPIATIGIRGSDITVDYDAPSRSMNVVTTHGVATLRTANDSVNLRGGFGITVSGFDTRLSAPTALAAAQIAAANRQFEGLSGRSAGAGKPPTDDDVARSGLSKSVGAKGAATESVGAAGNAPMQVPFAPGPNDTQQTFETQQPQQTQSPPPPPPPPAPIARTDRTLNGYVTGLAVPTTPSNETSVVMNTAPSEMTIRTVPDAVGSGRVSATFVYRSALSSANAAQPSSSVEIKLGQPPGGGPATLSRFANDQVFEASQSAARADNRAKFNGAPVQVSAVLVSVPMTTAVGTLSGDTNAGPACDCEFLTWGTWGAELRSTPSNSVLHRVPTGFWVAGSLPDIGDRPVQGIATFNGTAIGRVSDNGQLRTASGAFSNVYNFAQRSGRVDIRNFDGGKSFGGTVTAPGDWRHYSGALSGSNLSGSANGSFYGTRNAAKSGSAPQGDRRQLRGPRQRLQGRRSFPRPALGVSVRLPGRLPSRHPYHPGGGGSRERGAPMSRHRSVFGCRRKSAKLARWSGCYAQHRRPEVRQP